MPVAESWEEGRTHSMKRGRKKLCLPQGGMGPRLGGISFILQIQDQDSERQGSLTIVGWLALPNQSKESSIMDPILLSSTVESLFSV